MLTISFHFGKTFPIFLVNYYGGDFLLSFGGSIIKMVRVQARAPLWVCGDSEVAKTNTCIHARVRIQYRDYIYSILIFKNWYQSVIKSRLLHSLFLITIFSLVQLSKYDVKTYFFYIAISPSVYWSLYFKTLYIFFNLYIFFSRHCL